MGKATTTETKTRSARMVTTARRTKRVVEPKSKKAPSPYNLFVKAQLPIWKEANPDKSAKDAMAAVSVMWKDSPENPKNSTAAKKETKTKKPTSKAASKPSKKDEEESPSSDAD